MTKREEKLKKAFAIPNIKVAKLLSKSLLIEVDGEKKYLIGDEFCFGINNKVIVAYWNNDAGEIVIIPLANLNE